MTSLHEFACTYEQVPEKNHNGDLANSRHVDGCLLLDFRREVSLAGEVDAHGAVAHVLQRYLVYVAWDTADDDVAYGQAVVDCPAGLLFDLVPVLAESCAAREDLHVVDVDAVHMGSVVGQERSKWATDYFAPVDDGDGTPVESVAIWQYGVVDAEVLEDLDDGERGAGQDALLRHGFIEEADVLVHVEDVLVRKALYILVDGDNLLQVLVLTIAKDGIVDDDTVDLVVFVRVNESFLKQLTIYLAELESEATVPSQRLCTAL